MEVVVVVGLGWTLSLCLHEFGHAIVAYWGGDESVQDKGYLTLNPLKYTDPTLSLVLPLFFLSIGGLALPGGAVYINRSQLRGRFWESAVSAAGPLANALVAILLALLFQQAELAPTSISWLWPGIAFLILLQISAVFLNLLPIPPLDGYGILEPWLPRSLQQQGRQISRYGIWIVFALFWFVPAFSNFFWTATAGVSAQLGVPLDLAWLGYETFRDRSLLLMLGLIVLFWLFRNKEQALYQKGNSQLRARRYQQAFESFDRAVQRRPDYHEAWYGRGNALAGLERYEEALASYNKAIQIQPEMPGLWFNRGLVLLELERWEAAAASFAKAGDRAADRQLAACSWGYRGRALRQLEQFEAALAAYQRAAELDPKFAPLWLWQAEVLAALGRDEAAIAALDRALEQKEHQPELWVRRSELLHRLGRYGEALSDCEQAIAQAPEAATAWLGRGAALLRLGRAAEAQDSFAYAASLQPDLAEAWYNQACAQATLGDREAAFAALKRALALTPERFAAAAQDDRDLAPLRTDDRWKALMTD